ncbi:MAG: LamB/YcsF family protein [Alkalibacterium sp.]|nr:LamB/YcsF family protein [Alkalibacterium sp.]
MMKVDLNCDLGESYGSYSMGMDQDVMPYITSANIACGFHAADPMVMAETVKAAEKLNISLGAHPGLPDLMGFGRREMAVKPEEVKNYVIYQMGALMAFSRSGRLHHVKPHGALYNMAAKDFTLARAICEGIKETDPNLILYGLANSELIKAAQSTGLSFAQEVFADRNYKEDGSLVPRNQPDAFIIDEAHAVERVITMVKEQKVKTVNGKWIDLKPDSICVHGDNPKAVQFARAIHAALKTEGIEVTAPL